MVRKPGKLCNYLEKYEETDELQHTENSLTGELGVGKNLDYKVKLLVIFMKLNQENRLWPLSAVEGFRMILSGERCFKNRFWELKNLRHLLTVERNTPPQTCKC